MILDYNINVRYKLIIFSTNSVVKCNVRILWIAEVPAGSILAELLAVSTGLNLLFQLVGYGLFGPTQLQIIIQHQNSA